MALAQLLITLGCLFALGLAMDLIGKRVRLPRVSLLMACGIVAGGSGLDLLPDQIQTLYEGLAVTALTMVAFLMGSALSIENLRGHGRAILSISVTVVAVTLAAVAGGLWLLGFDPVLCLILGAIATATAPAATEDVLEEAHASGPFVATVEGVVAIDDAWGLLAFSIVLALAAAFDGVAQGAALLGALREIGGAALLGLLVGWPAGYLTGRIRPGEPLQAEALSIVFLTSGLALWAGVSYLLAGMVAGAVIVNTARHHEREFHEIKNIRYPFLVLFFILAGASVELGRLADIALIAGAYVLLRLSGRIAGGWLGAVIGGTPARERGWYGLTLLPQAGVAMGMALVAAQSYPQYETTILTLAIGATVFFELLGPVATAWALRNTGGTGRAGA